MKDQRVRLYIIKGVPESTVFEPQTRKEISVCLFGSGSAPAFVLSKNQRGAVS